MPKTTKKQQKEKVILYIINLSNDEVQYELIKIKKGNIFETIFEFILDPSDPSGFLEAPSPSKIRKIISYYSNTYNAEVIYTNEDPDPEGNE